MENRIPQSIPKLVTLGSYMADGLAKLAVVLGITQVTAAQMSAATAAVVAAQAGYGSRKSARGAAYASFHAADAALAQFLVKVRAVLIPHFGTQWNAQWAQAGYASGSTRVPKTIAGRLGLTVSLINFLTANPGDEVPGAGVTAAAAAARHAAALAGKVAAAGADALALTARTTREAAVTALRGAMRMLIGILGVTLGPDDPRWDDFGLHRPGAPSTPTAPHGLAATADAPGTLLASCEATPLATHYRWRTQVVGAEGAYTLNASTQEPLARLTGFTPGALVSVIVQAVNGPAQSAPSAPVVVSLPGAVAAAAAPIAPPNGHGLAPRGNGTSAPELARAG